ncbi:MAG: hypothetical protein JWM09_1358 [Francisellaceae bacterium]|nr:hypothetical protein [Francisellaceae bacterium]
MEKEYNKYQCYLIDFCREIKEEALEAKKNQKAQNLQVFNEGYSFAYHRVVDLMLQFADNFNIGLNELSLDDIDPYKDLL